MIIYVVYDTTTTDHPGKYVIRRFHGDRPERDPWTVTADYRQAIKTIPAGLVRIPRYQNDDPVILETWI